MLVQFQVGVEPLPWFEHGWLCFVGRGDLFTWVSKGNQQHKTHPPYVNTYPPGMVCMCVWLVVRHASELLMDALLGRFV